MNLDGWITAGFGLWLGSHWLEAIVLLVCLVALAIGAVIGGVCILVGLFQDLSDRRRRK